MGCNGQGNCGDACCIFPFQFVKKWNRRRRLGAHLGQLWPWPEPSGGVPSGEPCLTDDNMWGYLTSTGHCEPMIVPAPGSGGQTGPGSGVGVEPCSLPDGSIGWRYQGSNICNTTFSWPGGGQPAPNVPGPGRPNIPGMVTEADCVARENAAAEAAARIEEGKVVKYSAITAVVGAIVGGIVGRVI